MNLLKIIAVIVILWVLLKAKHILLRILMRSSKVVREKRRADKLFMDIQDADYEDVE